MNTVKMIKYSILQLCIIQNRTAHALASHSGVLPSTPAGILNGATKNPGIVTIKLLCDGLGITLSDFFDTPEFRALEQEMK